MQSCGELFGMPSGHPISPSAVPQRTATSLTGQTVSIRRRPARRRLSTGNRMLPGMNDDLVTDTDRSQTGHSFCVCMLPYACHVAVVERKLKWDSVYAVANDMLCILHAGVTSAVQSDTPRPVYQDRQKLFNRIAPVYDQVCCQTFQSCHVSQDLGVLRWCAST